MIIIIIEMIIMLLAVGFIAHAHVKRTCEYSPA